MVSHPQWYEEAAALDEVRFVDHQLVDLPLQRLLDLVGARAIPALHALVRGGAVRLELRSAAAQTEGNVGKNLVAFEKKLF